MFKVALKQVSTTKDKCLFAIFKVFMRHWSQLRCTNEYFEQDWKVALLEKIFVVGFILIG